MKRWMFRLFLVAALGFSLALVRLWYVQASGARPGQEPQAIAETTFTPTASHTATQQPSATATMTSTGVPTATPAATTTPTSTPSPSHTPPPSQTPSPSATPFATLLPEELAPDAVVPTPVPTFEKPDAVTNVILLGNDVGAPQGGRTDSIIIVSIDEEHGTASMLSLPRDLYVVIPGWKITRINQALPHGHGSGYPGGGGGLIKDTVLYNFGIEVDYYVRVGFDAFQEVIDHLGGVQVAVSCELTDWRLIEPDLDPQEEDNWEMFSLGPGIYDMDGDLALWYVRSRRSSSDFERGRRQQQILRAILEKGLELEMVTQLPALWQTYQDTVETDLPFSEIIRLAALAPIVRENGIQHLFLPEQARRAWMTSGGAAVQLLQWDGARPVLAQLMRPPVLNRALRAPLTVEVVTDDEVQYLLAADNLAYHGFVPVWVNRNGPAPSHTAVSFYGANLKGSYDWLLSWIIGIDESAIRLEPAAETGADRYRVELGTNYDPCKPQLEAPSLGRS